MATTTATMTTAAMTAPMMTGLGPFFGAAAAIFFFASGRMWLLSPLSEQMVVKAVCRTWAHDEPRGTGRECYVAQYLQWVLRPGGRDGYPAAETAAVNGQPAGPGRGDADDERQHQQAAHDGRRTREEAEDQQQPDQYLH